jgi:benzoyl-CoA reductase/2-hydroxyglutaryl-CoA dehydratase subunit BcrC/BadD/HgdB
MKRDKDKELWRSEVRDFLAEVENFTGNKITAGSLQQAIQDVNGKRRALLRLSALRKNSPSPISGKDCLLIEQISMYDDVPRFTAQLNALCDELETRVREGKGIGNPGAARLIVSGTPMALPNWKVPHVIETSGAVIVAEEMCTGLRYFENLVPENGETVNDMVGDIAARYLDINCACFTPNKPRMDKLVQLAEEYKADGIIHCSLAFCDPYLVEANRVEKALQEHNIPLLKLETDYGQEDSGQIKTRVEAFLEMIEKK